MWSKRSPIYEISRHCQLNGIEFYFSFEKSTYQIRIGKRFNFSSTLTEAIDKAWIDIKRIKI